MTNFTREIKRELVRKVPPAREEKEALFCGALSSGGGILTEGDAPVGFFFSGESEGTAEYLLALFSELFGAEMRLSSARAAGRRNILTFSYTGEEGGRIAKELFFRGGEQFFPQAECFLKGAFLGGGSCTLPKEGKKTGYHLETVFGDAERAEEFLALLEVCQLQGNIVRRNGKFVVYTKSREAIADFLAAVGANGALKTLFAVASAREENNLENRKENCYAQNADKSAIASARQTLLLSRLKDSGKLFFLSEELQTTARARLEHPELSLFELATLLNVSKSCVNHRLRKLAQIALQSDL